MKLLLLSPAFAGDNLFYGLQKPRVSLDDAKAAAVQMMASCAVELANQEVGKGKAGPGRGNKTSDIVTRLDDRGNTADYLAARIKRDHPEVHQT